MGLNIKSPTAEAAIRELAALTGESLTSAIENAVREKIERAKREQRSAEALWNDPNLRALQEIFARDPRTREEIDDELYDEHGLPR